MQSYRSWLAYVTSYGKVKGCHPTGGMDGVIIPLPKKGDLADCNNWRGITLLSVPGKVFCSILLERIQAAVDSQLRQEQAGFRRGRLCNDQIFALRQIIQKVTAWQRPTIMHFIDFSKAFDCIHRPSLWFILKKYGLPVEVITIIQNLYDEGQSAVKWSGTYSRGVVQSHDRSEAGMHFVTCSICPDYGLDNEKSTGWH